ncbi:MAG TPA: NUDIX hydrolase, partial [Candidatus Dormibacteraeota bacterium]
MSSLDPHLREEPLRRRTVYEGKLLHVFEDTVRLPGGREAGREVVEHPGAVTVVASDDSDRVVLVRQWRHAVGRALWELPAGTREKGEQPA